MRILLIEDNPADVRLVRMALNEGGLGDCVLVDVPRLADGLKLLAQEKFDALLLDLSLPDASGLGAVVAIQRNTTEVPIIVLTGTDSQELGVAAIQVGAQDYLVKGNAGSKRVFRAIHYAVSRKEVETQTLTRERLETAGHIAGQIADDFNNLLVPLVGYPELIKLELPAGHKAAEYCDLMLEVANQLVTMNANLLALTRRGRLAPELTDVNQAVRRVLDSLGGDPRPEIERTLADGLSPVMAVAEDVAQIVLNLARYSRETAREPSGLSVRTFAVEAFEPFGQDVQIPPGSYVRVDITQPAGLRPPHHDGGLGAPFAARSPDIYRGANLDLNIARVLAEDHHGYIDRQDGLGGETTFSLLLPSAAGAIADVGSSGRASG